MAPTTVRFTETVRRLGLALGALLLVATQVPAQPAPLSTPGDLLRTARNWAYQLQALDEDGAVDALVATPHDVLVLEPTRSDRDSADFPTAEMVARLHASDGAGSDRSKLVLAYIDIGEAEDWRWYWQSWWVPPTETSRGNPDFLITVDPDGWSGNYPVAYWDPRWQEIIVTGANSALRQVLDDGFDGIYMDWVEAFDDDMVIAAAAEESVDPVQAMIGFIALIRSTARASDPDFLVVPQNAVTLGNLHSDYLTIIDGIGMEDIHFSGEGDTQWGDSESGDIRTPDSGGEYTRVWYYQQLNVYQGAGLPVFSCDYALIPTNIDESYRLSRAHGYKPFVSQTPLDRLPAHVPPLTMSGAEVR